MSKLLFKRNLIRPTKLIVEGYHIEKCELENKKPPLIELKRIPFQNELLKFNSSLINSYQKSQDISNPKIKKNSSFSINKNLSQGEMKNALLNFLNEKINKKHKTPRNKKFKIKIFNTDDLSFIDKNNDIKNNNNNYKNRNRFYTNHRIILPFKNKKLKLQKNYLKTEMNYNTNNNLKTQFNIHKNIEKISIHYDNEIENNFKITSIMNKK